MLGTRATVDAVAECLPSRDAVPIVLDPVLLASSGGMLLDPEGREAMGKRLFPRVTLLTPNVPEAASILGEDPATSEAALISQAGRLLAQGPEAVLLKGGHAAGNEAVDWLIARGQPVLRIASPRVATSRRGTGCSLASAIAASLASGMGLVEACRRAKDYLRDYLTDSS
jgi:hydroxymethylpyrimidine/phosphomethylpyrimidine kinase